MSENENILGTAEVLIPRVDPQTSFQSGEGQEQWLCVACHQPVASERERIQVHGAAEHTFVNPAGIRFCILLFGQVSGCLNVGVPTLEHTWFPGCAWSYCLCGRCRSHLGWFYTGARVFVALIRERVVRASLVHN
ncbi:cereblon family protein [Fontisphaera persica]|uniref:cereblon family protein n=1 Tax=Fontisphaera persica TaxID=2974023 RepID=UPI0024BF7BA6|nr:cereblon family protein [Fontisphaera persica]WCJ58123.1 cereblon family protein [Fontisphaera persica]